MERIRAHEEKEMRLLAEEDQHELSVQGWRDARDADEENKAARMERVRERIYLHLMWAGPHYQTAFQLELPLDVHQARVTRVRGRI